MNLNRGTYIWYILILGLILVLGGCQRSNPDSSASPTTKTETTTIETTLPSTTSSQTLVITSTQSSIGPTTKLPTTITSSPSTTSTKTATTSSNVPTILPYPFTDRNMFFGLSLINPIKDSQIVKELGISWLSLEPHVIWFSIEKIPGVYDWQALDAEVKLLQTMGLDITMVLSPIFNAFGTERQAVMDDIAHSSSQGSWLREGNVSELKIYPHEETLPLWLNFVTAAVSRYDGDGINDMPGLKYAARNWHFAEEFPIPELQDEKIYVDLLKVTSETIKVEDPQARVILVGLAGNYLQYFAFMDGYITDQDAGVVDSQKHPRLWWNVNPFWKNEKRKFEYILDAGRNYFDIVDIHTYIPKESFMEGEIEYIQKTMQKLGFQKPVWIIEGGGPFKNYPGKKAENSPGDPYFGFGSEKENAEFVIKLHAMSAAKGVERQHWGLNASEDGYWDGPWEGMPLRDSTGYKKPSYYTFKIMREKLDGFTQVKDLSQSSLRIFNFKMNGKDVYIVWNPQDVNSVADLSSIVGNRDVKITGIVTQLDAYLNPVYPKSETKNSKAVTVGITPIFIE